MAAVLVVFIVGGIAGLVRSVTGDEGGGQSTNPDGSLGTVANVTSSAPPASSTPSSSVESNDATSSAAPSPTTAPLAGDDPLELDATAPVVDAAAYAIYDRTADEWLSAEDPDLERPVGSVIKLLTAYVVMEAGDPTKVVTVPQLSLHPMESQIGLVAGEQQQREVLLRAMLIVSANDAAKTLAIDIGGTESEFVMMMNAAADELGLDGTTAANSSGLDASGAGSTARDVIELADLLMDDEAFRTTVARGDARLHGQTFPATNEMLRTYQGADGVKTGSTTQGGYSVVASATRNGRQILVAVLGAPTDAGRFDDAAELLDWAFTLT